MKTKRNLLAAAAILPAFLAVNASAAVRYVDVNNASPTPPYTNWATAAIIIQDAVDVAMAGDEVVVTNGIYQTGGRTVDGTMTNRVAVTKPLTLHSVNGPEVTVIDGSRAVRCVYLTNGAAVVGFTLTNGTAISGGGVWCGSASTVVSNCVLSGNSASSEGGGSYGGTLNNCTLNGNSAYIGGGARLGILNTCTLSGNSAYDGGGSAGNLYGSVAYSGILNNCILTGNSAENSGGGTMGGTLNNCTLTGNLAGNGGGVAQSCGRLGCSCDLNNCIVYHNAAPIGANYSDAVSFNYCCTTPLPLFGEGNFTNPPFFVDQAGGNLRLQANSPCINGGLNAYSPAGLDLDGRPRVGGGTVDMGAYEFQSPRSVISYAWLQGYGLPTDGSVDFTDADGDGLNNWQEWRCLTDPTNALSVLRLRAPASSAPGVNVSWQSVSNRTYFLERGTNLGAQPAFLPFATGIVGQAGTTIYLDTNTVGHGTFFYRVGVSP